MTYTASYASPLGEVLLSSDGSALTGLWFAGQKYFAAGLAEDVREQSDLPVFEAVRAWLDAYFAGEEPGPLPPVAFAGTPFQHMVWEELLRIPYGETCTYGDLAQRIGERRGSPTSARAVGAAVGRNPVSVIVPCHRVLGAGGALTGYAGGVWRKWALLTLEQRGISIAEAAERPSTCGMGAGRLLLERATEFYGVTELSVNEQNPHAVSFYEHMGFSTYSRTETDAQGDPFPLLYMRRS